MTFRRSESALLDWSEFDSDSAAGGEEVDYPNPQTILLEGDRLLVVENLRKWLPSMN
jgi:hypothetical protein